MGPSSTCPRRLDENPRSEDTSECDPNTPFITGKSQENIKHICI